MALKAPKWAFLGALLLAALCCDAGGLSNSVAKLEPFAPFPSLQAAAKAGGIPLEGVDPPARDDALCPGDSVTALVTLHEKGRRRTQWLIFFQAENNSGEHRDPMIMYTSTGRKFEFDGSGANINVRTVGPFVEPNSKRHQPTVNDKSAQVSVNKDFLSLGLDRGAATVMRWTDAAREKGGADFMGAFSFGPTPFDGSRINRSRKLAALFQVTPDEERSVAGWIPALTCYFGTVEQTPNLKGILLKVLNMPSLWSFVRNHGVKAFIGIDHKNVKQVSAAGWGLPSGFPVYALPSMLSINDHKALAMTMIVTTPRPPFLTCGGIIALLAENPDDGENYLTLRVISAHGRSCLAEKN